MPDTVADPKKTIIDVTGSCSCGAIAFQAKGPILFNVLCHCKACSRARACSPVHLITIPTFAFQITAGEKYVKHWKDGKMTFAFCTECGCGIYQTKEGKDIRALFPVTFQIEQGEFGAKLPEDMLPMAHVNYENRLKDSTDTLPKFARFRGGDRVNNDGSLLLQTDQPTTTLSSSSSSSSPGPTVMVTEEAEIVNENENTRQLSPENKKMHDEHSLDKNSNKNKDHKKDEMHRVHFGSLPGNHGDAHRMRASSPPPADHHVHFGYLPGKHGEAHHMRPASPPPSEHHVHFGSLPGNHGVAHTVRPPSPPPADHHVHFGSLPGQHGEPHNVRPSSPPPERPPSPPLLGSRDNSPIINMQSSVTVNDNHGHHHVHFGPLLVQEGTIDATTSNSSQQQ